MTDEELKAAFAVINNWYRKELAFKRPSELRKEYVRRAAPLIRYVWERDIQRLGPFTDDEFSRRG